MYGNVSVHDNRFLFSKPHVTGFMHLGAVANLTVARNTMQGGGQPPDAVLYSNDMVSAEANVCQSASGRPMACRFSNNSYSY